MIGFGESCFYCGADVDPDSYDENPRGAKVYMCNASACHREFREDMRAEYERECFDAQEDVNARWGMGW